MCQDDPPYEAVQEIARPLFISPLKNLPCDTSKKLHSAKNNSGIPKDKPFRVRKNSGIFFLSNSAIWPHQGMSS
jgi:hypothetical protein